MELGLAGTLALLATAFAICGFAVVMDRRPYVPGRIWTVPYKMILFLGVFAAVVLAAHLVTVLTGVPLRGRLTPR